MCSELQFALQPSTEIPSRKLSVQHHEEYERLLLGSDNYMSLDSPTPNRLIGNSDGVLR